MKPGILQDERGSVVLLLALTLVPTMLAAGTAIDYGRSVAARTEMQATADSAALAAAALEGSDSDERRTIAARTFSENNTLATPVEVSFEMVGDRAIVTARTEVPTSLMKLAGIEHLDVTVRSVARIAQASPSCVILLEQNSEGLIVNSSSTLRSNCGIQINSTHQAALTANSGSSVVASSICVSGDTYIRGGSDVSPEPQIHCPSVSDPLASLPEPVEAQQACNFNSYTVNAYSSQTMIPGVYCGNTTINSFSDVTLQPGIYVFRDGDFLINSNSQATGTDVLLFFQGQNGRLNANSDSTVNFSGRRSGIHKGVLMFQSRHPITLSSPPHIINSDSASTMEGTIYVPNGHLFINSHSEANSTASYTAIVARRMDINSNGSWNVRGFDGTGDTPNAPLLQRAASRTARLIE